MEKLSEFLIRPFRSVYESDELGPKLFLMNENIYERSDFKVKNKKEQSLSCSIWSPKIKQEESYMAVLFCHGNCGNKLNVFEILEMLLENNIIVIAMDFSGAGLSEGDIVTYGHNEQDDIKSVVEYVYLKFSFINNLALWGRSMGAASILFYLAENQKLLHTQLNDFVVAAICDSPFADLPEVIHNVMSNLQIPTSFIRNYLFGKLRNGFLAKTQVDLVTLNPVSKVENIKNQSVLFIHGDNDSLIPMGHSLRLYQKSNKQSRLSIHSKGGHNDRRTDFIYNQCVQFLQGQNILKLGKKFNKRSKKKTLKQEFIQQFTDFSCQQNNNTSFKNKSRQDTEQYPSNSINCNKSLNYGDNESDFEMLNLSQDVNQGVSNNIYLNEEDIYVSDNDNMSKVNSSKTKKQEKKQELKESLRKKQQFFSHTNQNNNNLLFDQHNVQSFLESMDAENINSLERCREDEKREKEKLTNISEQQKEQNEELRMFMQSNKKRQQKNRMIKKNKIHDFSSNY